MLLDVLRSIKIALITDISKLCSKQLEPKKRSLPIPGLLSNIINLVFQSRLNFH